MQPIHRAARGRAGLTLIEVLIVVTAIALLVSLLLPVLGPSRTLARSVACCSTLRQLTAACIAYSRDWRDQMPAGGFAFGRVRGDGTKYDRGLMCAPALDETGTLEGPAGFGERVWSAGVLTAEWWGPSAYRCPADPSNWRRWGGSYIYRMPFLQDRAERRLSPITWLMASTPEHPSSTVLIHDEAPGSGWERPWTHGREERIKSGWTDSNGGWFDGSAREIPRGATALWP